MNGAAPLTQEQAADLINTIRERIITLTHKVDEQGLPNENDRERFEELAQEMQIAVNLSQHLFNYEQFYYGYIDSIFNEFAELQEVMGILQAEVNDPGPGEPMVVDNEGNNNMPANNPQGGRRKVKAIKKSKKTIRKTIKRLKRRSNKAKKSKRRSL